MARSAGAAVHSSLVIALAAVLAVLLFSGTAAATVFSGSAADPAGDGPVPGQDITRAKARYDSRQGTLEFDLRLGGAPSGNLQVTVGVGRRDANGNCGVPLLLIGGFLPNGPTIWLVEKDGSTPAEDQGQASQTVSGSEVRLRGQDPGLRGFRPNCAEALLSDPGNPSTIYDQVGPFAVKPPPPRPRLGANVARIGPLKRGASKAVAVRVSNTGNAPAAGVVVRARVKGSATLQPRLRKLGRIPAGKSRVARFRVKVKPRGKGKVTISARATGRRVSAHTAASFMIRIPKPPPRTATGGLAGKIFWGFESYRHDRSQDPVLLHFTDRRFVRWGFPKGGLKKCRRVTAKVSDGEMQPGCLRYRYNRARGTVRIGNARGAFRSGKLTMKMNDDVWTTDGATWYLGMAARPGTRFHTILINRGYYGCGVNPFCTTWKANLTLTRDGRFGWQDSSLSTGGGIGTGLPFVGISKLGPNERGRYRVLPGGKIRLSYANGKTVTETLIVQTNKRGRPDPVREGLLVGDTWFYPD